MKSKQKFSFADMSESCLWGNKKNKKCTCKGSKDEYERDRYGRPVKWLQINC